MLFSSFTNLSPLYQFFPTNETYICCLIWFKKILSSYDQYNIHISSKPYQSKFLGSSSIKVACNYQKLVIPIDYVIPQLYESLHLLALLPMWIRLLITLQSPPSCRPPLPSHNVTAFQTKTV